MPDIMNDDILRSLEIINKGGIILYPTDTVWGLGCDATNKKAVDRIFKIKKRPEKKSMIILLDEAEKLQLYVDKVPQIAFDLMESITTPLTIVYPKAKNIAKNLIPKDGTIAIRVVKDEFCRKLISLMNKPLVSTSANLSGEPTPLIYNKISTEIINHVDYVVRYARTRIDQVKPSTIIKFNSMGEYEIIRK